MVGRTISHYRILGQLGAGGMGTVYRAEDVRLGREVALKFIAEEFVHEQQAVQRLRSEARAASALNHGNICTIYDIDEHEGHPFIVMELLKGRTLRDRVASGPLKVHQLVDVGIEIADALHAAHTAGILHRDIKPANIFVNDNGHVKILDFGLAKLTPLFTGSGTTYDAGDPTVAGVTLGTIAYMSPEQATGEELDSRTDLFSLGVVLYECATGRHPFPGKTSAVVLAGILNRAPVSPLALNPELPVRLQDVIVNCLEKDRELRYQSAAEVRADLKRVRRDIESGHTQAVEGGGSAAASRARGLTPPSGSPIATAVNASGEASSVGSRSRRLLAVALAGVVVLGVASYALLRRSPEPPSAPDRVATTADDVVKDRLAQARVSMEARDYRAALAHAAGALSLDANNAAASKIRDDAREMLARFDVALAAARERMAAGDLRGAERALDAAQAIDPTSPATAEMSSRLAELRRREPAERAAGRERTAAEADASARRRESREPGRVEARRGSPAPSHPPSPSTESAAGQLPAPVQTPPAQAPPPATQAPPPSSQPLPTPPAPVPSAPAPPPSRPVVPDVSPPASEPVSPVKPAGTPPAAIAPTEKKSSPTSPSSPESDETAIRRVTALYGRAIEEKDLALFRSIKPNLTRAEERRLEEGFRAVTSQRVTLTIVSLDVQGQNARVVLKRRDTIEAGGRQQTADSQQTLTLNRTSGGWAIVDIR